MDGTGMFTVLIQVVVDPVRQLRFGDFETALHQINEGFFATVLQHFQAAHADRPGVLRQVELRRGQRAVRGDIEHLVAAV